METNATISETPSFSGPAEPAVPTSDGGMDWGTLVRYAVIVLILAFLGFNLFAYLGKVTGSLADVLGPVASWFGLGVTKVTKQTLKTSAEGTKGIVDVAAGAADDAIGLLEKGLDRNSQRNKVDDESSGPGIALDKAVQKQTEAQESVPEADDAGSVTQRPAGKAGYCYIGEDRGFRSCVKVNEADMCMSGDIFPSHALCINPNLRE